MEKQLFEIKLNQLGRFTNRGKCTKKNLPLDDDRIIWEAHPTTSPCPDCDRVVTDRRVQHKIEFVGTERQQWRKKCLECRDILGHSDSVE
jgi:hypothetical protein